MLALLLLVAGLLVPFIIAMFTNANIALYFGVVAILLALLFGIMGWKQKTGKITVIIIGCWGIVAGINHIINVNSRNRLIREMEMKVERLQAMRESLNSLNGRVTKEMLESVTTAYSILNNNKLTSTELNDLKVLIDQIQKNEDRTFDIEWGTPSDRIAANHVIFFYSDSVCVFRMEVVCGYVSFGKNTTFRLYPWDKELNELYSLLYQIDHRHNPNNKPGDLHIGPDKEDK